MVHGSMSSGYIPPTPTILEWRALIDSLKECSRDERRAVLCRIYRRDNQSISCAMAIQTLGKAGLESRLIDLLRVHRVIDEALRGFDRNEFENFSLLNRSHGDLVIEKNCARRFGRNIRQLKTRFRE